jgi:hypothetical protein
LIPAPPRPHRLALVALLAALCVALFVPAASAAPKENGGVLGPGQRPQLLLIHGGSFIF